MCKDPPVETGGFYVFLHQRRTEERDLTFDNVKLTALSDNLT